MTSETSVTGSANWFIMVQLSKFYEITNVCLDVLIWIANLLQEIVLVQLDVFHNYVERKPKSVLREKIEKSMVCFVLTSTLFCWHLVLCCSIP